MPEIAAGNRRKAHVGKRRKPHLRAPPARAPVAPEHDSELALGSSCAGMRCSFKLPSSFKDNPKLPLRCFAPVAGPEKEAL
eukprot:2611680-Alexandrium_andersonii.AAC.1